jgi:biotin transport system substrate-specific component
LQSTPALTLADAVFPRPAGDSRAAAWARDIALMIGFAVFVAVFAQIAVRLPWTTVPITGQTFATLVTGGALGMKRGAGALTIYMIAGMFLLPVFAPGSAVLGEGEWAVHFVLPWSGTESLLWNISSGGYIVGFILAAALVGYLAEREWDRKQWVQLAMLLGTVLVYLPGLAWLAYLIATDWVPPGAAQPIGEFISGSTTLDKTLKGGLYPFIVGDLMKVLLAAMVLPGAWLLAEKLGRRRR